MLQVWFALLCFALHTIGNISDQSIEEECPSQGIQQCLLELVHLKVLVSDSLLIASNTLNGKDLVFLAEETCVELIVRDDPEEDEADADGQASGDQEDDLPGLNVGSMETGSFCDAIRHQATEDLCESVKREPDACARTLFLLGVPLNVVSIFCMTSDIFVAYLRCQQGESRCYSRFSNLSSDQLRVAWSLQESCHIPPSMKRTATPPEKFLTAANVHKVIPQRMMLQAEYFPSGSRCSNLFVGYSQAIYPK